MQNRFDFSQLDHVPTSIFVLRVTDDGRPVYAALNAFALEFAGRPLADWVGKTALEIYGGAMGQLAYDRHCAVVQSREPMTYDLELPMLTGTKSVRTSLNPVRDADGRVTLIYGTSNDHTNARQVQESQVQIETLTNEMEQFVAMAAHDLRAPMRNVGLLADMLRDGFVDHGDGKTELIDMLEDMAKKSLRLITDVLSHARATSVEDRTTEFAFPELCRDILAVLDPSSQHRLDTSEALLCADRAALQIVVRNLMENAIKHGGRDHLAITAQVTAKDAGCIEVTIADDGTGFENPGHRFLENGEFRIDSGYGLLGIRRLIKARGGTITAANKDEGGGIVTFSLPGTLQ